MPRAGYVVSSLDISSPPVIAEQTLMRFLYSWLVKAIIDVQSIRLLCHDDQASPLPGFPILAIETAWQCHYVAFSSSETRENFRAHLADLVPKRSGKSIDYLAGSVVA